MRSQYGKGYKDLGSAEICNLKSILEKTDTSKPEEIKAFILMVKDEYNLSYKAISDLLGEYGIVKTRQSIYQIVKSANSSAEPKERIEFRGNSLVDRVMNLRALGYTQLEIANIVVGFANKSFDYEYRVVRNMCNKYIAEIYPLFMCYTSELIDELRLRVLDFSIGNRQKIQEKIAYDGHIVKDKEFDIMLGRAYSSIVKDDIKDKVRFIRVVFGEEALDRVYHIMVEELNYQTILKISKEAMGNTSSLNSDTSYL